MNHDSDETSEFRYQGNRIPRVLRLAWTVLILFCVVYLVKYAWPDWKEWLSLVNK